MVQGWEPGYCQTDQDESGTLFSGWVALDQVFNLSELSVPLSSCCTEGILGNKEEWDFTSDPVEFFVLGRLGKKRK